MENQSFLNSLKADELAVKMVRNQHFTSTANLTLIGGYTDPLKVAETHAEFWLASFKNNMIFGYNSQLMTQRLASFQAPDA